MPPSPLPLSIAISPSYLPPSAYLSPSLATWPRCYLTLRLPRTHYPLSRLASPSSSSLITVPSLASLLFAPPFPSSGNDMPQSTPANSSQYCCDRADRFLRVLSQGTGTPERVLVFLVFMISCDELTLWLSMALAVSRLSSQWQDTEVHGLRCYERVPAVHGGDAALASCIGNERPKLRDIDLSTLSVTLILPSARQSLLLSFPHASLPLLAHLWDILVYIFGSPAAYRFLARYPYARML
ncbi:hypothetical protein C8F01DRAFT_509225 [Mycena amicta]|nr:hypothetical protein C8F01DRAFT_509225 [Mycena amicta]